ncbi:AT hook motif protein [Thermoascus aurantiacus ATCC 26904]
MPMTWNNQADAKLLAGIIKICKPKMNLEALAQYMGPDCTAYAVQHRIRKIQAKAEGKNKDPGSSAPSTPSRRKSKGNGDNVSPTKKAKAAPVAEDEAST